MLDLCAAGLDVDGVDSSADMVERCRANANERGLTTHVYCQRAEALNLERRYASIYFAGPTFNLLATDDTAKQALSAIRRHLTDDGAALIPLWIPDPTPATDLGVSRTAHDGPGIELTYTPLHETYDQERRTRVTTSRYERITATGTESADREWIIHWHTPQSFAAMCHDAGLQITSMIDDDTNDVATDASTGFTATVHPVVRGTS